MVKDAKDIEMVVKEYCEKMKNKNPKRVHFHYSGKKERKVFWASLHDYV